MAEARMEDFEYKVGGGSKVVGTPLQVKGEGLDTGLCRGEEKRHEVWSAGVTTAYTAPLL